MSTLHLSSPAERVLLGAGTSAAVPGELARQGRERVVLACSATLARETPLVRGLEEALGERHRATYTGLSQHSPEAAVLALAELLRRHGADALVSFGGGSVIDGGKAALQMAEATSALHLALPTTLSGAEFTESAGITEATTGAKRSLRDRRSAPKVVVLDPELSLSTPLWLWLSSGVRALDHAVEAVLAPEPDPLATLLALEAVRRLREALPGCRARERDLEARLQAQTAAWWAALCLAALPMGPSHQLGRLLGAPFQVPHGITSCVFLPTVIASVAEREPDRLGALAPAFGVAGADQVASACRALVEELGLPTTLRGAGLDEERLERFLAMLPEELRPLAKLSY